MRRRDFITFVGSSAVAWPLAAHAQQRERVRRIGVLTMAYVETDPEGQARFAAFRETFRNLGWADGRNVRIEYHWGAGTADLGKAAAAELVRSAPDVILVASNAPLAEVRALTSSIRSCSRRFPTRSAGASSAAWRGRRQLRAPRRRVMWYHGRHR